MTPVVMQYYMQTGKNSVFSTNEKNILSCNDIKNFHNLVFNIIYLS